MSELSAADKWIYTTLAADVSLVAVVGARIYADLAPQGAALPYVVFSMQATTDLMTVGPNRVWTNSLYWIRGIAETTSYGGNLGTIADRIDAVLQAASGSNVDGSIWQCVRERPNRLTEVAEGRTYRQSGGIYRLWVSKV